MHFIHTFVLRLLYDPQDPETLRGSLQAVSEKEVRLNYHYLERGCHFQIAIVWQNGSWVIKGIWPCR